MASVTDTVFYNNNKTAETLNEASEKEGNSIG